MTIEEMRQHQWTVSWSGGKDSTATIIKMHEYNIPIQNIIYVRMMYDENLPATLPIMTTFVDNAISIFRNWGYNVSVIKSIKTAEELINRKYQRSKHKERNGNFYGITAFNRGHCIFTSVKQQTIDSITSTEFSMLGYAADERERLHRLTDTKCSILQTLNITEAECFDICEEYGLLSPLYKLGIKRDGCFFCPNASKKAREILKSNYPEHIEKIQKMINICGYDLTSLIDRNNWLKEFYHG